MCATLLAALCGSASAEPSFKHILPGEVSALGYINSIAQDEQGFMWFAGANGLGRYDGYDLTLFRHNPDQKGGLSHSYVNEILPADNGDLWLATRRGVNYFDASTRTFTRHRHPDQSAFGARANDVRDIVRLGQRLWIASRGGLFVYDLETEQYRAIPLIDSDKDEGSSVWALAVDQQGKLWLGTQRHGVLRYHPATDRLEQFAHRENDPKSISDNDVRQVYIDPDNRVWFGTYGGGLARFNRDTNDFVRYPNDNHEKSTTVWDILRDSDGQYWVGDGSAVNRFDPQTGRFEGYSYKEGQPSTPGNHVIQTLYEDRTGNLWVGYFPAGVDLVDETASAFKNHAHDPANKNSITDGGVVSAHEGPQGDLWIGAGYGLNHWDREKDKFTRITRDEKRENTLTGNTILAIEQIDRELWLGIWSGGLNRMNLDTGKITHYRAASGPKSLPGDEPWALTVDNRGRLWAATDAGLARYNRESDDFTTFQPAEEQLSGDQRLYSRVVYQDRRGQIWVGGIGGLYRLNEAAGDFTRYTQNPDDPGSLSAAFVLSLYEDSRGIVWVGTEGGGLNRFNRNTETFSAYTEEDGLADNTVTSIVESPDGDIWVSTHQGLSQLNVEQESIRSFTSRQGLGGNLFNRNTGLVTQRGEVFFGHSKGFTLFDPSDLQPNPHPPPVRLTDIQILNESVPTIEQPEGPAQSVTFAETLTLEPEQSVVTFQYSALSYRSPENNQYAYRLVGFEDEWNRVGTKRTATYTNLDPGQYRFEVKAANNDGFWSEQPHTLRVRVLPPLWQTGWAYALYGFLLLALVSWLVYTQRQKLARERQVVQRLQQVDQLKDEFLANTSHELRTPLNGIIGLAESMMDGATGELPKAAQFNLNMIVTGGRRLAGLVDDILDFAKLRHQGIQLQRRAVDLRVLVEIVLTLSRPLVGGKALELRNHVPPYLPRVYADEDRLLQVLHNLVGNAVKFTERGEVTITAEALPDSEQVRFSVTDTGIGIAPREIEHLFESFRQVSGASDRLYGGTGLGLSVTHQLIELHGGRLDVESQPERGSTFTVTLPSAGTDIDAHPSYTPQADYPAPEPEPEQPQVMMPEVARQTGAHVLVVDDEPVNRQVLVNYLALAGYRVSECHSGEEALASIHEQPDVDLILLDVMMPNLSGYDTCRALRQHYSALELPVIFLTAKRQTSDLLQAFDAGGNDFLSKPFARDELLARVQTHLQFLDIHRNLDNKVAERTDELIRINQGLEQAQSEIRSAYRQLEQASVTDPLTELNNRRFVNDQLPGDISLCVRRYREWLEGRSPRPHNSDCIFVLMDIDHFKVVNDSYGHAAGDRVLEQLGDILREVKRESDHLVRWGGEEFLLVARFTDRTQAPVLAERLRAAVESALLDLGNGQTLHRTCSVGYAPFPFYSRKPEALSWEQVIDTADRALYAAKRSGRNCWVGLEEGEIPPSGDTNPSTSEHLNEQIERGVWIARSSSDSKPFD